MKPPHPPNKTPLLLKENQCEAKCREGEKDLRGGMVSDVLARGSTPDFSRRGWSNGGKNQNQKKCDFWGFSNKAPKETRTKNWLTSKKSHAEFSSLKAVTFGCTLFGRTTRLGYTSTTKNLQSVLNTPKNQATQKNTCQSFQAPKNPESKSSNPKNSLHHPRQLKSGVPPPTPPPPFHWTLRYTLLYSCSNLAAISCRCLLVRAPRIAIIASSSLPVIDRKRKKQRQRARIFK